MVDIRSCEICKALLTVEEQEKNTLRYANKEHYVCELVASGKSVEEAVIEVAEFLPGSWLCRYFTIKQICNEIAKGRTPKEVIEEIKEKEPLRYRGCIAGEGIIYEIDLPDDEVLEAGVNEGDKGRERSEGSRIGW